MNFILKSSQEIMQDIATRAREIRLSQNLTQAGLSLRSGVSLGSLKRFEKTGEISLKSLIDIANALGCLSDFEQLFQGYPIQKYPGKCYNPCYKVCLFAWQTDDWSSLRKNKFHPSMVVFLM